MRTPVQTVPEFRTLFKYADCQSYLSIKKHLRFDSSNFGFLQGVHCTGGTPESGLRASIFLELIKCHSKRCSLNFEQCTCETVRDIWIWMKSGKKVVREVPEIKVRFCWFTNLTLLFWKYGRRPNFIVLAQKLLKLSRSQTDRQTDRRTDRQTDGHGSNIFFCDSMQLCKRYL